MHPIESTEIFKISKVSNNKAAKSDNHYHHYYELLFVCSGHFNYFIEDKIIEVLPNSVIMVGKDTIHKASLSANDPYMYFVIHFSEDTIDAQILSKMSSMFETKSLSLDPALYTVIRMLFSDMYRETSEKNESWNILIRHKLNELIILLFRIAAQKEISNRNNDKPIELALKHVNDCIDKEEFSKIGLTHIAKAFYMSPSYFSKKFKKETGIGFKQYVLIKKVLRAKKLMESTNLSITEIAFKSGFSDSNYFSTAFKKMEGIPPSTYERLMKAGTSNKVKKDAARVQTSHIRLVGTH